MTRFATRANNGNAIDANELQRFRRLRETGAVLLSKLRIDARALHSELQSLLPGYLVPRLLREVAGAPAKTTL